MIASVVGLATLTSGLIGLYLQRVLPEAHSVDKACEMIGAVTGLVTLLVAFVLGTIVGSAYYFSAGQQAELQISDVVARGALRTGLPVFVSRDHDTFRRSLRATITPLVASLFSHPGSLRAQATWREPGP
jgi:hypothetical protein